MSCPCFSCRYIAVLEVIIQTCNLQNIRITLPTVQREHQSGVARMLICRMVDLRTVQTPHRDQSQLLEQVRSPPPTVQLYNTYNQPREHEQRQRQHTQEMRSPTPRLTQPSTSQLDDDIIFVEDM